MTFHNHFIQQHLKIYLNKTALHIAIQKNNVEIVKLLLEMPGIDVNIPLILNHKNIHIVQIISL